MKRAAWLCAFRAVALVLVSSCVPSVPMTSTPVVPASVRGAVILLAPTADEQARTVTAALRQELAAMGFSCVEGGAHHARLEVARGVEESGPAFMSLPSAAKIVTARLVKHGVVYASATYVRPPMSADVDPTVAARALARDLARSPSLERLSLDHQDVEDAPAAQAPKAPPRAPTDAFVAGRSPRPTQAIVIGITRYRDAPAAEGARADAERFAQMLEVSLGVARDRVTTLYDDLATRNDLSGALTALEQRVEPGDRVVLFFAGHGAPDPVTGRAFLVPFEASPVAVEHASLPIDDVLARLSRTRAAEVIAFVDACFSGAGGRSVLSRGTRGLVRVKEVAPPARLALFTAARAEEIASATGQGDGGLFTHFVLEGLGQRRADFDGDGRVTLSELAEYVTPRVEREASRLTRSQHPRLVAEGAGKLVLTTKAEGAP